MSFRPRDRFRFSEITPASGIGNFGRGKQDDVWSG